MSNPHTLAPALPLVAYAEQLCKGSRVLVVGEGGLELAEAILGRGARLVHVFERDAARRAEAQARSPSRAITIGAPEEGMREGFFDLVLVENLASEPDPENTVRSLGRLMAPRGAALFATPNPEAKSPLFAGSSASRSLDYYALYDTVTAGMPHVRMLGQVPFVGYALIDFAAEGEPAPVFDTSLVSPRGEEPDYFIAFASHHPKALDEYAVIQLPSSNLARSIPVAEAPAPPPVVEAPRQAPDDRDARRIAEAARIAELERQLAKQEAWIVEIEARASTADERADAAESELDELREKIGNQEQRSTAETASLRSERDEARAETERLRRRVNDVSDLLELKKVELTALTNDPVAVPEIERLEAQLKEQGQKMRRLEADLREAERTGRSLVRRLTAPPAVVAPPAPAEAAPESSALEVAERLAQAEAELVSLRWSLSILTHGRTAGPLAPGMEQ
jgi:SAM-dependent methyltransferase